MKTIKTRQTSKNIKILDKSISMPMRMKDTFVRTKDNAKETKDSRHTSPVDYASENVHKAVQRTARSSAAKTVCYLKNPRQKAHESLNRAKANAIKLRKEADSAFNQAKETKAALRNAKMSLKQVKQRGRQTIREVKSDVRQNMKILRGGAKQARRGNSSAITGRQSLFTGRRSSVTRTLPIDAAKHPVSGVPNIRRRTTSFLAPSAQMRHKAVRPENIYGAKPDKGTIKTAKKSVKTAKKTAKGAVQTAKQTAKSARKTSQAAAKTAKASQRAVQVAAKTAAQTTKTAAKAVTAMIKAAIAALKGLVAAITAGGWAAVTIILIICMIGLLVGSIFGIFFSGEPSGSGKTINSVIAEIDDEYMNKIDDIISANAHDLVDMSGARASWKEVLAVYTVKTVTDPENPMEVATVDDEKANILRSIFWEMNDISYTVGSASVEEDVTGSDGLPTGETITVSKTVLRITVSHKTSAEIAEQYGFTNEQTTWLDELFKPEYYSLWNGLLYGIMTVGDASMLEIAETQLGNVGGEPYWRWYGFNGRVEWCAIFVSWCAEQCGYIDSGIIPKFSGCMNGVQWFKSRGQWQDSTYTPRPGDIIFFDWEPDGHCDHVGIVESVSNGKVNTIEGNTSDSCRRRSYEIGSSKIYGYATPAYH